MRSARRRRRSTTLAERWRDLYRLALAGVPRPVGSLGRRLGPAQGPRQRRQARPRRPHPADPAQQRGLRDFQTDFYSYRYFASEGFLPGYSFPRLPLAAYIPGLARRHGDGRLHPAAPVPRHRRVRPRRAHLPRGRPLPGHPRPAAAPAEPGQDGTVTETARRCRDCGYHHPEAVGIDVCEHCDEPLRDTTRACCACNRRTPAAGTGSPPTRRNAAGPDSSCRPPTGSATTAASPAGSTRPATDEDGPAARASPTATPRRSGSPTSAGAAARTRTSTAT